MTKEKKVIKEPFNPRQRKRLEEILFPNLEEYHGKRSSSVRTARILLITAKEARIDIEKIVSEIPLNLQEDIPLLKNEIKEIYRFPKNHNPKSFLFDNINMVDHRIIIEIYKNLYFETGNRDVIKELLSLNIDYGKIIPEENTLRIIPSTNMRAKIIAKSINKNFNDFLNMKIINSEETLKKLSRSNSIIKSTKDKGIISTYYEGAYPTFFGEDYTAFMIIQGLYDSKAPRIIRENERKRFIIQSQLDIAKVPPKETTEGYEHYSIEEDKIIRTIMDENFNIIRKQEWYETKIDGTKYSANESIYLFQEKKLLGKIIDYAVSTINYHKRMKLMEEMIRIMSEKEEEIKRIIKEFEEARKKLTDDEISYSTAHELKNAMTPIAGYLSLIEKTIKKDYEIKTEKEKIIKYLKKAKEGLEKTITIIMKKLGLKKEKRTKLIRTIEEIIEEKKYEREVTIERGYFKQEIEYGKDLRLLKTALESIITNSYQALQESKEKEKKIRIEVNERKIDGKDYYIITIMDNGPGIPKENREKIFEPGYTTKKEQKGTGIGLFLTKTIIEKDYFGEIRVDKSPLGKTGAMFEVLIEKR